MTTNRRRSAVQFPQVVSGVRANEPIDGTRRRRRGGGTPVSAPASPVRAVRVDPVLLQAAQAARRRGERLVVVDQVTIRLVPSRDQD